MAEPIAALVVRILADTTDMVTGAKKASVELDGLENRVVDVDKALQEIHAAGAQAKVGVGELTTTYRQFDGVLQSVGINIGPQVKGIEDIASAAGKSAAGLGAVSTAGLALGVGVAGWGIGRAIADFFDLDKAIAQTSARLLGYGDLAAETAGAKQDVINRAIAEGARETITYAAAVQFLVAAELKRSDAYAVSTERLAAAHKEVRGLSEATIAAIAIAQENGATTEQITRHFNVSADALRVLAERQRDAGKAAAEHTREMKELDQSYTKLMSDVKNANQMAIFEKDADTQRRAEENQRQLDLMNRDADLLANRKAFDDAEAVEANRLAWERDYFAEQEQLDRENQQWMVPADTAPQTSRIVGSSVPGQFASVMNPPQITINAQGAFLNNPDSLNQLARLVGDALAKREGFSTAYSRR